MSTHAGRAGANEGNADHGALPGVIAFVLTWFAAGFASSIALLLGGDADPQPIPVLAVSLVVGWSVFLLGTWLTSRNLGTGHPVDDFALRARPIDLVGVPIGVVSQLFLIPALYFPLRELWPATFDDAALSETAEDLVDRADGAMIVLLFVLVVFGAPIVEEVVYRGLLQRPLLDDFPPWAVVTGVALVFALVHFRPVEYPGLFAAGLVFGVLAWRTGRIGAAVAAHVGFNATGLVLAL
ncbi:CPBP family intramembrane glutamic endopeptidase [Ilumatobacter nonamiensis]|uniref:CPBP family intramembrane glutamic endopeptidase n=1 Tax=Ilumatobacter nonamiensis TaxID=467093 RepID=UPI000348B70D|nr:CPBP family intramembrane glutamic endopeptidase [Ilumatobacter nonamiensis]